MLTAVQRIVRIVPIVIAFCVMASWANAATRSTATRPFADVMATFQVNDSGDAQLMGAFIESDYVAPHGVPNTRLQQQGLQEAVHGRYAFNEAISYLKTSARGAAVLARIERSGGRISIVINHQCNDDQKMVMGGNSLILWDPYCAYRIGGSSDSPSLVLMHELIHTLHLSDNPQAYLDNSVAKNKAFDTVEERNTILYGEIPIARELGEAIRTNHHEYRPFRVTDPTLR